MQAIINAFNQAEEQFSKATTRSLKRSIRAYRKDSTERGQAIYAAALAEMGLRLMDHEVDAFRKTERILSDYSANKAFVSGSVEFIINDDNTCTIKEGGQIISTLVAPRLRADDKGITLLSTGSTTEVSIDRNTKKITCSASGHYESFKLTDEEYTCLFLAFRNNF